MEETDVVILGAGVAGLFTAYKLIKQNFKGTITIVEEGLSVERRISRRNGRQEVLRGVGGPGFFTDGKVCLSEFAGTRLPTLIDHSILRDYVHLTQEVLQELLPNDDLTPSSINEEILACQESELKMVGLKLALAYPVLYLGTERVRDLALAFEKFLRNHNVRFLTNTVAREILQQSEDTISIRIEKNSESEDIYCRYLIVAVGKSGHDWLCKQFERWNFRLIPNSPDIGIRLEFLNPATERLLNKVQNPRIVMDWNDTSIKTHCWCYGGRISTYDYLNSTFVDGEVFKDSLTKYTSVSLLYHFIDSLDQDAVKNVRILLQEMFQLSQGYPLMQTLGAMRGEQCSYQSLKGSASSKLFQEAKLERLFPKVIIEGLIEFILRMDVVYPGVADDSTLIYAPVIEWDTYRVPVDEHMRTPIPNIYAVGDGAGLSQGIVTAATSGMIAADHLSQIFSKTYSRNKLLEVF